MSLLEDIKKKKGTRVFSDEEIEVALASLTGEISALQASVAVGGTGGNATQYIFPVLKEAYRRGRLKIVNEMK